MPERPTIQHAVMHYTQTQKAINDEEIKEEIWLLVSWTV